MIDVFAIYYLEKKIQLIFVLEEEHEHPILTGLVLRKRGGGFIDVSQGMKNKLRGGIIIKKTGQFGTMSQIGGDRK